MAGTRLNPEERRAQAVQLLRKHGFLTFRQLADELGVAEQTIRRDIELLVKGSRVRDVRGGAVPADSHMFEPNLAGRSVKDVAAKERIASEVVRQLRGSETVYLDEGFTPELIAHEMPDRPMRVATSSLTVAHALREKSNIEITILGGTLRPETLATSSYWAIEMTRQMRFDVALVGANRISYRHGLTTPIHNVSDVKQNVVSGSQRTIVFGVSSKWEGSPDEHWFANVADLSMIVTDRNLPESRLAELRRVNGLVVATV